MLAAVVVLLRSLRLICSGHRAVALENLALGQQLSVFRRTVRRPLHAVRISSFPIVRLCPRQLDSSIATPRNQGYSLNMSCRGCGDTAASEEVAMSRDRLPGIFGLFGLLLASLVAATVVPTAQAPAAATGEL